jgi:hypothetical protein
VPLQRDLGELPSVHASRQAHIADEHVNARTGLDDP